MLPAPGGGPSEAEEILAFHSPRCAHREVAELGCLVGGIPALHDTVEAFRPLVLAIALEPFRLNQAAAQRGTVCILAKGYGDCASPGIPSPSASPAFAEPPGRYLQEVGFAPDSAVEEAGFELLVPQINSSAVLTPAAMAGISLMFVFDAHLA